MSNNIWKNIVVCIEIWHTFWWLDLVLGIDQEDTNLLANVFFEHQEHVLKEFYTMNWCHRKAVRLSWKCHQRVGLSNHEKQIAAVVEQLQSKKKRSLTTIKSGTKSKKNWYIGNLGKSIKTETLKHVSMLKKTCKA